MFRTEFDCPELTCVVERTLKSKTVGINTSQIIYEITKAIHQKVKNIYSENKVKSEVYESGYFHNIDIPWI